jgi:hypothetical protein
VPQIAQRVLLTLAEFLEGRFALGLDTGQPFWSDAQKHLDLDLQKRYET